MNKWTALFNKWLQGSTDRDERHLLEKKGLEDEFIGDALEGFELYQLAGSKEIHERLQRRLKEQTKKEKKIFTIWTYGMAASLVILAMSAILFYQSDQKPQVDLSYLDSSLESADSNISMVVKKDAQNSHEQKAQITESGDNIEMTRRITDNDVTSKPEEIKSGNISTIESNSASQSSPQPQSRARSTRKPDGPIALSTSDHINESSAPYSESIVTNESASIIAADNSGNVEMSEESKVTMPISPAISNDDNDGTISKAYERTINQTNSADTNNYASLAVMSRKRGISYADDVKSTETEQINDTDVGESPMAISIIKEETSDHGIKEEDDSVVMTREYKPTSVQKNHLYHQIDPDSTALKPLIGWEAFDRIVQSNMPTTEWLFMRGIKEGQNSKMIIELLGEEKYQIINPGVLSEQNIIKILDDTGPWQKINTIDTIEYEYQIIPQNK